LRRLEEISSINERLEKVQAENDLDGFKQLIEDLGIVCPLSGSKNWTEVRQFNLMFGTELGSVAGDASTYLFTS
jgi:glycyl-tRNA synthetase